MAHQRLAIVDPASGDQPLFNEDKSVVVTVTLKTVFFHIPIDEDFGLINDELVG